MNSSKSEPCEVQHCNAENELADVARLGASGDKDANPEHAHHDPLDEHDPVGAWQCEVQEKVFHDSPLPLRLATILQFYIARTSSGLRGLARGVVVADHLIDDETQEFLAERWIKTGLVGERAQSCDLHRLTVRVGRSKTRGCLVFADPLGDLESFREHMNQRRIDVVDAGSTFTEHFVVVHGRAS